MKKNNREQALRQIILLSFAILISLIAYRSFFAYGWYVQDDYLTLQMGGAGSIIETTNRIVHWLNEFQGRYQPFRLLLFSTTTHWFQEEQAPIVGFVLHAMNLALLFFVLRKFSASNIQALITVLIFSLFGRYRMMESPSTMIGGSGLNLFLFLTTVLLVVRAIQESGSNSKKFSWYGLSLVPFIALTFSYEIAFPLFAAIAAAFFIFNNKQIKDKKLNLLWLLPYVGILLVFLLAFRTSGGGSVGSYSGAQVSIGVDTLTRFVSYLRYTLVYPAALHLTHGAIIFFIAYFAAIAFAWRIDKEEVNELTQSGKVGNLELLGFGLVFYFSSMLLFVINNWLTPTSIMVHHTYIITAGAAIVLVAFFRHLGQIFAGIVQRRYYQALILVFCPIYLISGIVDIERFYSAQATRTNQIKSLKQGVLSATSNPEQVDAVLVMNLPEDYYQISSMDGAFLQWFNFAKYIHSGDDIAAFNDNQIDFMGPQSYYKFIVKQQSVANNRVEFLYADGDTNHVLQYKKNVNFETGQNIFQTKSVFNKTPACNPGNNMSAILRNENGDNAISLNFESNRTLADFLANSSVQINGENHAVASIQGKSVYIALNSHDKYAIIKILSGSEVRSTLSSLEFSQMPPKLEQREVRALPAELKVLDVGEPQIAWKDGFYALEGSGKNTWRWASPQSVMEIQNSASTPVRLGLKMALIAGSPGKYEVKISGDIFNDSVVIGTPPTQYSKEIVVPPGKHKVVFTSNSPKPTWANDPRDLSFMIKTFKVYECESIIPGKSNASQNSSW